MSRYSSRAFAAPPAAITSRSCSLSNSEAMVPSGANLTRSFSFSRTSGEALSPSGRGSASAQSMVV